MRSSRRSSSMSAWRGPPPGRREHADADRRFGLLARVRRDGRLLAQRRRGARRAAHLVPSRPGHGRGDAGHLPRTGPGPRRAARAAGDRTYDWDGRLGGASLPDGTYLLQLVGVRGGMSYAAPAADMTDPKLPLGGATFTVDTAPPAITPMSVTQTWISPDGDGRQEIARLTAVASAGAVRWSISVGDAAGTLVRTFSGDGGVIDAAWGGRGGGGASLGAGAGARA